MRSVLEPKYVLCLYHGCQIDLNCPLGKATRKKQMVSITFLDAKTEHYQYEVNKTTLLVGFSPFWQLRLEEEPLH